MTRLRTKRLSTHADHQHSTIVNNRFFSKKLTLHSLTEDDVLIACMLSKNPDEMRFILKLKLNRVIHASAICHYFDRPHRNTFYNRIRQLQLEVIEHAETILNKSWLDKAVITQYCVRWSLSSHSSRKITYQFYKKAIILATYLMCESFLEAQKIIAQLPFHLDDDQIKKFKAVKETEAFFLTELQVSSKVINLTKESNLSLEEENSDHFETISSTSETWFTCITPEELLFDCDLTLADSQYFSGKNEENHDSLSSTSEDFVFDLNDPFISITNYTLMNGY